MSTKHDLNSLLGAIERQFLCCYPVNQIEWNRILPILTWDAQEELIGCTIGNALNKRYPIRHGYQINFVKFLLKTLEESHKDINDIVYESLCELLKVCHDEDNHFAFKHYSISNLGIQITLRESKNFVCGGTTGLCSWQASVALSDFLLNNYSIIKNKNILELGAGTGLCGILLKRCLPVGEVLITDGSDDCVDLIKTNISLNFNHSERLEQPIAAKLRWNDVQNFEWSTYKQPQIILAADVVYNEDLFKDLTNAIDFIFSMRDNDIIMLLAATVRNELTLNCFISEMEKLNFKFRNTDTLTENECSLYWDASTPIKIFEIKRLTNLKC